MTDLTTITRLAAVRKGEDFTLRGYIYRALGDAETSDAHGYRSVRIDAKRQQGDTPDERLMWDLATVLESTKLEG